MGLAHTIKHHQTLKSYMIDSLSLIGHELLESGRQILFAYADESLLFALV